MSYWRKIVRDIIVYFLLFRVIRSETKFLQYDPLEETESVAKCVVAVANIDPNRRPTIVISNGDTTTDSLNIKDGYVRTLTKLLAKAFIPQIVIKDLDYLSETVENYVENLLIVPVVDNCDSLTQLSEKIIVNKYKYIIIVNEKLTENCSRVLANVGRILQHQDATFIFKDITNLNHNFLTTIPEIDGETCRFDSKVAPTLVNTCTKGSLKDTIVFPAKKPRNLKKCEFNVGMATMYPYATAVNKESLQNLQSVNGSEIWGSDVEVIKIISDFYNASLKLFYIYREEESPYLHLEYVPFLLNGSLDACAGGLYRIYGDLVIYSGTYTRQAVIWVYAVEREPRTWQTVVHKINGLYIFILFYIAYSFIWIWFCNFDHISVSCRNTFLYSWGALIGTSSLQESITWKQKVLNISYLLLCLHLSAYFSVQLYSFFTIQGPPQTLKTNDEVMESGRTPYLNYDTKYFVEDAKYKAFANTSQDCADFRDCENKTLVNKGLTVIPEGYFYPLQAVTAVDNEARVLRAWENIFVLYHEMIVRKDSPFAGKFEWIVQRLFEAGICDRLYLEAIGLLIEARAENANANILANSYSCESGCAITVSQIAGAIYLWMLGCGLSFVIFMIEVVMNKNSTSNRKSRHRDE